MWKKRKGFTLLEVIVVIAILGLLVLIGMPKYTGYVREAELTRLKVECSELGEASMKYYMSKGDWPRKNDEFYSKEEVLAFGKRIVDETGIVVELDAGGKYYDLDYSKLGNYISKPEKGYNYVLQNPVGRVYGVEKVEEKRKTEYTEEVVEDKTPPIIMDGKLNTAPIPTIRIPQGYITGETIQQVDNPRELDWGYTYVDAEGDSIRQVEWLGKEGTYNTGGEHIISLRVQDSRGMWSEWVNQSIWIIRLAGSQLPFGTEYKTTGVWKVGTEADKVGDGTLNAWVPPSRGGSVEIKLPQELEIRGIGFLSRLTGAGIVNFDVYARVNNVWVLLTRQGKYVQSYATPGITNDTILFGSVRVKELKITMDAITGSWLSIAEFSLITP